MTNRHAHIRIAAAAGLACSSLAFAQNTNEIEPNETKAAATFVAAPMNPGDTLTGNTTGTSTSTPGAASADTWRIKTAVAAAGIYQYRLVLPVGWTGGTLGLNQTAATQAPWPGASGTGTASETIQQTSIAIASFPTNQWYGFGKGEEMYYRVTGTVSTTANYVATLQRIPVTPGTVSGTFLPGSITISTLNQGHTTDTEVWVYDSSFNAIVGYGDDDEAPTAISGVPGATGTTLQSALKRNYAAGTYYLAVSNFQMQNNLGSPCDDDWRTGPMLDFPNAVLESAISPTSTNLQFSITDGTTTTVVPNTRITAFDINWFKFVVATPPPACYADCDGVGGLTGNDFQCFLNAFVANNTYADCDGVGGLTGNDFQCFLNKFVAGCS